MNPCPLFFLDGGIAILPIFARAHLAPSASRSSLSVGWATAGGLRIGVHQAARSCVQVVTAWHRVRTHAVLAAVVVATDRLL